MTTETTGTTFSMVERMLSLLSSGNIAVRKHCRKEESSRLSLRSAYNNKRCSSFTRLHLHSLYSSYYIRECQCVFFTSCMTVPVLSIIYRARVSLVTLMTEKPGAGEQNTVPVVGLTLRAREAEELTT